MAQVTTADKIIDLMHVGNRYLVHVQDDEPKKEYRVIATYTNGNGKLTTGHTLHLSRARGIAEHLNTSKNHRGTISARVQERDVSEWKDYE